MDDKELGKLIDDFQYETKKMIRNSKDVDAMNDLAFKAVGYIVKAYNKNKEK